MNIDTKKAALEYHQRDGRPGKIGIIPTKPYQSGEDLSLAYSPGVAYPCLEIKNEPSDVYKYTNKGNLVAVISNGTAVLGLGNIGPLAGKPVMEGKALLFKIFAGLDAFDIEIDETDPEKFIQTVKAISPTFGGINLEDIKAPECFEIERRLKAECDIPIMHDDQHGTAIISAAGLINALEIQGKRAEDVRVVVNGAGAAAISCSRLYMMLGVKRENIVMLDRNGVIRKDRPDLSPTKEEFATDLDLFTLTDAMKDADVFLGLSVKDVVTQEMLRSMASKPIVFALANPDPEIAYDLAMSSRDDLIFATGRSDYPNQINNVLGFPYIFRGAIDCSASEINDTMKLAAAYAIADLAKKPVPTVVNAAYHDNNLSFGPHYILPKPLDPRLLTVVSVAVARAAMETGVAKRPIEDFDKYEIELRRNLGYDDKLVRRFTEVARCKPQRVVFAQADTDNMLQAAIKVAEAGIAKPILLGNRDSIARRAKHLELSLDAVTIINPRIDSNIPIRERYANTLFKENQRKGINLISAQEKMFDSNYFAMMMVKSGEADAVIIGTYSGADHAVQTAREVIGIEPGYNHFASMHILNTKRGPIFIADTAINHTHDVDTLVDITRLTHNAVKQYTYNPVMAMVSYSNFGATSSEGSSLESHEAIKILHEKYPEIEIDGEMQVQYALDTQLRDQTYPFNRLAEKQVNTLIFPNLSAANTVYQTLYKMGVGDVIGPIQIGLRQAVHFTSIDANVRDIVNLTTMAVIDARVKSA